MKKLYLLLIIIIALIGIPAANAQTQQTIRVLADDAEKACVAKEGFYRLQVPLIGCDMAQNNETVCCSSDGVYTIALKGIPSFIATMVRFGFIVVITIMFLMLIVSGIQFQLSFGDPSAAAKSIERVKHAAMGLVVVLFSTVILYQINPDLISLKIDTPEEIAQTVCCKIPSGGGSGGAGLATGRGGSLGVQKINLDGTVSVTADNGDVTTYTLSSGGYCTWVVKDSAGTIVYRNVAAKACPDNINFPKVYNNTNWEATVDGVLTSYTIDPTNNTCTFSTFDPINRLPSIPEPCPAGTTNPNGQPTEVKREIHTTPATTGSTSSFKYYVATNMASGKFVCNPPDEEEEDVNKCFISGEDEEDIGNPLVDYSQLVNISGDNIKVTSAANDPRTLKDNLPLIQSAAATLKSKNIEMWLTSGFRTLSAQQAIIKKNCPPGATSSTQCSPATALNGSAHMSGKAVDFWGALNGVQCITQSACKANIASCAKLPCQRAVIDAMKAEGFCVLSIEPWHFEKPKVSGTCGDF